MLKRILSLLLLISLLFSFGFSAFAEDNLNVSPVLEAADVLLSDTEPSALDSVSSLLPEVASADDPLSVPSSDSSDHTEQLPASEDTSSASDNLLAEEAEVLLAEEAEVLPAGEEAEVLPAEEATPDSADQPEFISPAPMGASSEDGEVLSDDEPADESGIFSPSAPSDSDVSNALPLPAEDEDSQMQLDSEISTLFSSTGTCGDNLVWSFEDGVLTISGSGPMYDYESAASPWRAFSGEIEALNLENGITAIGAYAFSDCNCLSAVSLPSSVIEIGKLAFRYCSGLTTVIIPASVRSIDREAFGEGIFYGCSQLQSAGPIGGGFNIEFGWTDIIPDNAFSRSDVSSVMIPDGITSIGNYVFYSCKLTSVVIPEGLISIGYDAFSSCKSLTSVVIPDSVISIGHYAFGYCDKLTSVKLPNSITEISSSLFEECDSLSSINIPDNVTSIGSHAFSNCDCLTSIVIPSGVITIEEAAFSGCKLTSLNIPDSVTTIGQHAFDGCSISSVIIPDSVTNLGGSAFAFCENLEHVVVPKSVVTIPKAYYWGPFWGCSKLQTAGPLGGDYNIEFGWDETIPDGAFSGCTALSSVTLPDTIATIEGYAFYGCSNLNTISLPVSVSSIGWSTFSECSILSNVHYGGPESRRDYLQSSGKWSSYGNEPLFNAAWQYTDSEAGWDYCGNSLFWQYDAQSRALYIRGSGEMWNYSRSSGNSDYPAPWSTYESRILSVQIEDGATSIGQYAFYGLTKLRTISIPGTISEIGSYAFYNCNSLSGINLPDGITSIGQYAFYNCMALTSATVPGSVAVISEGAFSGCSHLSVITLCPGLEEIGNDAFNNCISLNSISVPAGVHRIGGFAFYRCQNLKDVIIPDTVTEINAAAFSNCRSLTAVSLPANLESIAQNAFSSTGLTSIVIPSTVKRIDENAFSYCGNLKMISFLGDPPAIYGNSFTNVVANAYYPADAGWWEDDLQNYGGTLTWIRVNADGYAPSFIDVADPSRYYYNPVYWAVENGITVGYGGPNLFSPDAPCTREQIVTFLWRLMGEPEPVSSSNFADVSMDKWYYKPITWAYENGITTGYADGSNKFGVGDPCTREQAVTFLWRAAGKPAPSGSNSFTDMRSGAYYINAVTWAVDKGITVGLNDGTGRFGVGTTCSRAMIVTFLYRYSNSL